MAIEKQFIIGGVETVDVLLSSNTSNGQLSIMVETCQPEAGPPPHTHTLEDEFFMPLAGDFEFFSGGIWQPVPASGAFAPRNHVHTWRNSGGTWGKLLIVATGNSFDKFLEKFAGMKLPEQMGEMIAMSAEHGISYVLPAQSEAAEAREELVLA